MEFKTLVDLPLDSTNHLMKEAWPAFMIPSHQMIKTWNQVRSRFPQLQICLLDAGEIVGLVNTVPLFWDGDLKTLPNSWEQVLETSLQSNVKTANALVAVNLVVDINHRRQGISQTLLRRVKIVAKHLRYHYVLVPLRPSFKQQVPDMGFSEYLNQTHENGEPFDPWIRTHWRLGAKMIKVIPQSFPVHASLSKWRKWTAIDFDHNGQYDVPGALMPVDIDLNRDVGVYNEPGVWMKYEV